MSWVNADIFASVGYRKYRPSRRYQCHSRPRREQWAILHRLFCVNQAPTGTGTKLAPMAAPSLSILVVLNLHQLLECLFIPKVRIVHLSNQDSGTWRRQRAHRRATVRMHWVSKTAKSLPKGSINASSIDSFRDERSKVYLGLNLQSRLQMI